MNTEMQIAQKLAPLVNLRLAIARDAGSMKNFQFGTIYRHPSGEGTVGDYALHIQCAWRLVAPDRIVTGSADYYEPATNAAEVNLEDHLSGNRQRERLRELLGGYDRSTRSLVNETDMLVVTAVRPDQWGGLEIDLSGGFCLHLFPNGSRGEDWRFFCPTGEHEHLVIEAGEARA